MSYLQGRKKGVLGGGDSSCGGIKVEIAVVADSERNDFKPRSTLSHFCPLMALHHKPQFAFC